MPPNFDKQSFYKFFITDHVQGFRSSFVKVVIDPLSSEQKNYKGLLFYQKNKENLEKRGFLVILISKNVPDMAKVHKFGYF